MIWWHIQETESFSAFSIHSRFQFGKWSIISANFDWTYTDWCGRLMIKSQTEVLVHRNCAFGPFRTNPDMLYANMSNPFQILFALEFRLWRTICPLALEYFRTLVFSFLVNGFDFDWKRSNSISKREQKQMTNDFLSQFLIVK